MAVYGVKVLRDAIHLLAENEIGNLKIIFRTVILITMSIFVLMFLMMPEYERNGSFTPLYVVYSIGITLYLWRELKTKRFPAFFHDKFLFSFALLIPSGYFLFLLLFAILRFLLTKE